MRRLVCQCQLVRGFAQRQRGRRLHIKPNGIVAANLGARQDGRPDSAMRLVHSDNLAAGIKQFRAAPSEQGSRPHLGSPNDGLLTKKLASRPLNLAILRELRTRDAEQSKPSINTPCGNRNSVFSDVPMLAANAVTRPRLWQTLPDGMTLPAHLRGLVFLLRTDRFYR
jgi:hypothetical protein